MHTYVTDIRTLRDLLALPHSLALVLTSPTRDQKPSYPNNNIINRATAGAAADNSSKDKENDNNSNSRDNQQQSLLMLTDCAPAQDTIRWCVPVMSLTTFLREWSALMSIRSNRLMPLAPYLMKASPVVSSQHLR